MSIFAIFVTLLAVFAAAQRSDGQFFPCNPLKNGTNICDPNPGLTTSIYSVDFTAQTSQPPNWTISNYATVNYGRQGAEFTFAKRYDAPQLWTDFFILFGKVEVVLQSAPGTGIISSAVLVSDDFDEIDWEFSGTQNDVWTNMGQNNYFGKGITGSYDRGSYFPVDRPQSTFHTYTIDWKPEFLTWAVDGVVLRTLLASQCDNDTHQYPQTPSKIQLGLWDGGDPSADTGTKAWAGGETNFTQAPFTFYVKSVKVESYNPAYAYNYTDISGKWQSIQLLQAPKSNVTATSSTSLPVTTSTLSQSTTSASTTISTSPTSANSATKSTPDSSSISTTLLSSLSKSSNSLSTASSTSSATTSTVTPFGTSTPTHATSTPSSSSSSSSSSTVSASTKLASNTSSSVNSVTRTTTVSTSISTVTKTTASTSEGTSISSTSASTVNKSTSSLSSSLTGATGTSHSTTATASSSVSSVWNSPSGWRGWADFWHPGQARPGW